MTMKCDMEREARHTFKEITVVSLSKVVVINVKVTPY